MSILEEGLSEETGWVRGAETVQAHYSSIMLHRKCPNAWYFRYGLGLGKPISGPAPYLHYGSWFGAIRTAEALVRGRKAGSLIQEPRSFTPVDGGPALDMKTLEPRDVLEAAVAWWKGQANDPLIVEEWHKTLGEDLPNRLKGGFLRWRDEWGEAAKKEEPLGLELFWKRALPRTGLDVEVDLPNMNLIGYIDELYRDTERNMIVVRDNKTSSRMPTQSSVDDMMDSQLQLYAWGVTPALQKLGLPAPSATSYDRAFSKKATSPKLNLNGTLSASAKLFDKRTYLEWAVTDTRLDEETLKEQAVKAGKRSSWEDFNEEEQAAILNMPAGRVYGTVGTFSAKGAPKFGIYQVDPEVVKGLETPDWKRQFHQRTLVPINRNIIQTHLRAAADTVVDIWRTQQRATTVYEGARNLSKDGCRWCDYVNLCRAQMFGGPEGTYDLREYGLRSKITGNVILSQGEFYQDLPQLDYDPSEMLDL